jgi:putative FmdB family regulatory protein
MPLYEYQCARCGKRFELIQRFSDPAEAACPDCGGRAQRQLSPPALQFKGSGWYVTDYARKSSSAGKSEEAAGSTGVAGAAPAEKAVPAKTEPK